MDTLATGLIAIFNGLMTLVGTIMSPLTLMILVSAGSLAFLAVCELDETDRQSHKPEIARH